MNYAVATKGLTVIDCDSQEAVRTFRSSYRPPSTFTVKTARGYHFYFRGEMRGRVGALSKLDVKSGPGSYVVGPGSIHASGAIYASWEDDLIAELPNDIRTITTRPEKDAAPAGDGLIPVGLRNDTLTKFAGFLRGAGANQEAMFEALKALNRNMTVDPLPDNEVRQIARSISKKPGKLWPALVSFSDIPEEQLEWLWYPFVPRHIGTAGWRSAARLSIVRRTISVSLRPRVRADVGIGRHRVTLDLLSKFPSFHNPGWALDRAVMRCLRVAQQTGSDETCLTRTAQATVDRCPLDAGAGEAH